MLDAHQLNVFLAAAKTLNFTVAARHLHMTQPSVSQHIQSLEQHFDMPLFIRSGRHLRLSDAGNALLPLAQQLVTMSDQIEEAMESLKGEVHGHLMVGCSTTIGKYVLPLLLAGFMKLHPRVQASCFVTPRPAAVQMLCGGEVHLALASAREFCKDVEFHHFISDPIVFIVPLDHPWAVRGEIEVEELLDAQFIMREETSGTREVVSACLQACEMSLNQLNTVLTLGNSEAIALAVQEGIGVSFVSQMVVTRLVPDKVARVAIRGVQMEQKIYIGRHTGYPSSLAQNAFWEFVTDPHNPILAELDATAVGGDWPSFATLYQMETAV